MVYLFFILIVLFWGCIKPPTSTNFSQLLIHSFPVILFFVLIIGSQYRVGSDYTTYLDMFSGRIGLDYFDDKNEIVFSNFIRVCRSIGIEGQGVFFVLALFWIVLLLYAFSSFANSRYLYVFLFLFVVLSTAFNNQMNAVRQYTAVYISLLLFVNYIDGKYVIAAILFVMSLLIHTSTMLLLPIFLIIWRCPVVESRIFQSVIVVSGIVFSLIYKDEWLFRFVSIFDLYGNFNSNNEFVTSLSEINKWTKFVNLPILAASIYNYDLFGLSEREKKFYTLGIFSYAIQMACLSSSVTARFGMFFQIFQIIPIAYYLIYLLHRKKNIYKLVYMIVMLFLFFIYAVKVTVFAVGEYSYNSIFFMY